MREKSFRSVKHDGPAVFHNHTVSLPFAQETARSKGRDVGGIGQLFIRNINLHPARDFSAHTFRKTYQYPGNSFSGTVGDQGHMGCEEPGQIVPSNQQSILHELRIPCRKFSDRLASPDEYPAILYHFCTHKIRRWTGQECRASKYLSWLQPEK